jgi:hypothetical protein
LELQNSGLQKGGGGDGDALFFVGLALTGALAGAVMSFFLSACAQRDPVIPAETRSAERLITYLTGVPQDGASLAALTVLSTRGKDLTESAISALGRTLPLLQSLRELDLGNASIGDERIRILDFDQLPNLTILNLEGNLLSDAGLFTLCYYPLDLSRLSSLNLSRNTFGDQGARYIAAVISVCPRLTTLRLDDFDRLGVDGQNALLDVGYDPKTRIIDSHSVIPRGGRRTLSRKNRKNRRNRRNKRRTTRKY